MIDKSRLSELRYASLEEVACTLESLWKENAELKDSIRLNQGHMLHVMFTDCPECVAFHAMIRKERDVVRAAERYRRIHDGPTYDELSEALVALKAHP